MNKLERDKIRDRLYFAKIKLKDVAKKAKVTDSAVSQFFSGTFDSKDIRDALNELLKG